MLKEKSKNFCLEMSSSYQCLYCGKTELKQGDRVILSKSFENPSLVTSEAGKIRAASCLACTDIEKFQFDLTDLSVLSGIPFENFENYPCITNSFSSFSKNFPDSVKQKMLIGFRSRNWCRICWDYTKLGQNSADHYAEFHAGARLIPCTSGCGSYYREKEFERHKDLCGAYPGVKMCPFPGCRTTFRLKENEHEEDEYGTNEYLKHIMDYHVWKIDKNAK